MQCQAKFLSTLSLRRATFGRITSVSSGLNFYPRSPCGERLRSVDGSKSSIEISIHALLAESDHTQRAEWRQNKISIHALLAESDCTTTIIICIVSKFLSTLSLRRATSFGNSCTQAVPISIHALLAESDNRNLGSHRSNDNFYPRSPCGERLVHALKFANLMLFLSTLSLRRATNQDGMQKKHNQRFLSTLSLRRATLHQL